MSVTTLAGARRAKPHIFKKTELHLGRGTYKGYFIGLGDTFTENSGDPCGVCSGATTVNGEMCRTCTGTGKRGEVIKIAIRYQMGPELIEEEWVTYSISEGGVSRAGKTIGPSTLYLRMRDISRLNGDPAVTQWYEDLAHSGRPIKVPITMVVKNNQKGDGVMVSEVYYREPQSKAAPSPQQQSTFDDLDDEIPF